MKLYQCFPQSVEVRSTARLKFKKPEVWVAVIKHRATIRWKKIKSEIKLMTVIRHDGLVIILLDSIGQVVGY